jgi:hypothetical protein
MNQKKTYKCDWKPEFLYEVTVSSTGKKYTLTKGMWVSVARRPGLIAGKYEFLYAEVTKDGVLLLQVTGPVSREHRVKTIRESDIKTVHLKTKEG